MYTLHIAYITYRGGNVVRKYCRIPSARFCATHIAGDFIPDNAANYEMRIIVLKKYGRGFKFEAILLGLPAITTLMWKAKNSRRKYMINELGVNKYALRFTSAILALQHFTPQDMRQRKSSKYRI